MVIHSNYGSILYRFCDLISVEHRKFSYRDTPVHLVPTPRGFPLEFCNGSGAEETRRMPYQKVKNVWGYIHSFGHIIIYLWTEGHTWKWKSNIALCMPSWMCSLLQNLRNWIVLYGRYHNAENGIKTSFLLAAQWHSWNYDPHLLKSDKYIHAGHSQLYWTNRMPYQYHALDADMR